MRQNFALDMHNFKWIYKKEGALNINDLSRYLIVLEEHQVKPTK